MLKTLLALALSLFAMTGLVHAHGLSISGEVTYRERMALPAGSTLYVGLVALPSGKPVVGAGAAIPVKGQVPLQFSLNIRSDTVIAGGAFGLVAEIRAGTAVLFRNLLAVPVDLTTKEPVLIVVDRYTGEVAPPEPVIDPALVGATWRVTSISGSPTLGDRPLTLLIAPDLRADGHAGCNDYFTQASVEDGGLRFGLAAATRKACAPHLMAQEAAFFAALAAVSAYDLTDGSLRLLDAAKVPLIGLVRTED